MSMTFRFRHRSRFRVDPRIAKIEAALKVISTVAAQDADYAKQRNGVGFSRADSSKGHALAKASISAVMSDEATISEVLKLGKRYSRQAGNILQSNLF